MILHSKTSWEGGLLGMKVWEKTSANEGHKSDCQNDKKFNHNVPTGYDTKIGPHTGS